jgi:hypothetical protein
MHGTSKAYAVKQLLLACVFQLDRRQQLPTVELFDAPFLEPSTSRWPVWVDVVVPRCQETDAMLLVDYDGRAPLWRIVPYVNCYGSSVNDFEVHGFRTL